MEIHVYQGYMLVTNLLNVKLYLRRNIFLNTRDSTNKTNRTRANYSEVRLESKHLTGEERLPFLEQLFKYHDYQVPETSNCQTFHVSTCLKNKKKNFYRTNYQRALSHKAWKAEAVSFDYIELFYETAHTTMHYTFLLLLISSSQLWKWEILLGEGPLKYETATVICSTIIFLLSLVVPNFLQE